LDQVSGGRVFRDLYRRWVSSDRFPDLADAYRRLGLEAIDDTRLRLRTTPRPPLCAAVFSGADRPQPLVCYRPEARGHTGRSDTTHITSRRAAQQLLGPV